MKNPCHDQKQIPLERFFQNTFTLKAKIAFLTLYNIRFPKWFEISLLILEYLQLISQTILFLPDLSEAPEGRYFYRVFIYACKLINPSSLLSFENKDSTTESILTLILIFTALKYLALFYVITIASWDKKGSRSILTIWRFLFKTQGRIACYFISSFWTAAILNIRDQGFQLYGMSQTLAISILSILWAIEYIFSFLAEIQFSDVLSRKNFLSAKNFNLQLITLSQKMVLHILQLALRGNLENRLWVSAVVTVLFSIGRVYNFFITLPLYHIEALMLQAKLNSIVFGVSIACLFQAILMPSAYFEVNLEFIIMAGIVLSLLLAKASGGFLQEFIVRIFSTDIAENLPDLLVHKIIFLNQLMKYERSPQEYSSKYHWTFMASQVLSASQESIFGTDDESTKLTHTYLENLSLKFPQHRLTQLYLASMGIKKLKMSAKASKTITSIIKTPWSMEYLSAFFLLYQFREVLIKGLNQKKNTLDLTSFMQNQKYMSDLKDKMGKQAEMQISICKNILKENCNIGEIYENAQAIYKLRRAIRKEINLLPSGMSEYSIEHLLICAEYFLALEFSQTNSQRFWQGYHLKYFKYKKHFINLALLPENLYQSSNAFLILAGESKENGKIKYCSKSIKAMLGGDCQEYNSSHISSLFPSCMQTYYRNVFKQIFEKDENEIQLLDQVQTVFLRHKNDYIKKSHVYIQVHPYLNETIYLAMIIRSLSGLTEYILLKENGEIEGATKKISQLLGLKITGVHASVHIKQISEELALANEAFNVHLNHTGSLFTRSNRQSLLLDPSNSGRKSPKTPINPKLASELYDLYATEGQTVELKPVFFTENNSHHHQQQQQNSFHCKMKVFSLENSTLKVVELARSNKKPRGDESPASIRIKENFTECSGNNDIPASIPLEIIKKSENRLLTIMDSNMITTEGNLLSSPKHGGVELTPMLSGTRKLLADDDELSVGTQGDENKPEEENSQQVQEENLVDFMSVTSTTFRNVTEKAIIKAYRNNIVSKHYSRSFNLLCFAVYGVITMTLLGQIVLKIVYNQTMEDLVVRKDLLYYTQSRGYYAGKLAFLLEPAYAMTLGVDVWKLPVDPFKTSVQVAFATIPVQYNSMHEANVKILNLLDRISDENIKEKIFMKDVRINGSIYDITDKSEYNTTSFRSTDLMLGAVQYLMGIVTVQGLNNSKTTYDYIRQNLQNDLFAKNKEITKLFQASVDSQREHLRNFIVLCLVITPLLLAGIALLLTGIIWKQYSEESEHFRVFIKLDPHAIKFLLQDMEIFRDALGTTVNYEDKTIIELFWVHSNIIEKEKFKTRHFYYRNDTQTVEDRKIKQRYLWYVAHVIVLTGVLIGILLWNFASANKHTDIIYSRQTQLQLSNTLGEEVIITFQALVELYSSNDTLPFVHTTPSKYMKKAIKETQTLQTRMTTGFEELDGSYDPKIKEILFKGKACEEYETFYPLYCAGLKRLGFQTDALNLMITFQNQQKILYDRFWSTNRTSFFSLLQSFYVGITARQMINSLLGYQAQLLNAIITKNLEESITEAGKAQDKILGVFITCLVVVGLLIWIRILKHIKEVRNDFKKVLQVLPPKLVLSSYLLKQFLNKASGTALEKQY